jgi:hypothetical protein
MGGALEQPFLLGQSALAADSVDRAVSRRNE